MLPQGIAFSAFSLVVIFWIIFLLFQDTKLIYLLKSSHTINFCSKWSCCVCACVFFINGKNCIIICHRKQYSLCDSLASFQCMLSVALSLIHLSSLQDFLSPKHWNGRFAMDMHKIGFVQIRIIPYLFFSRKKEIRLGCLLLTLSVSLTYQNFYMQQR